MSSQDATVLELAERMAEPPIILVVEDEKQIQSFFKAFARRYFCKMHITESVTQAIDMLSSQKIDLVFPDIKLADGTGMDVLRHINLAAIDPHVVIMSGSVNFNDIMREANTLGVVSFLIKPNEFTVDRLAQVMFKAGFRVVKN